MGQLFDKPIKENEDEPENHDDDHDDADSAHAHERDDKVHPTSPKVMNQKDPVKWTELSIEELLQQKKAFLKGKKKGAKKGGHKKKGGHTGHGHGGHAHPKDKDIPHDWEKKCRAHYSWCETFLKKIIKKKKESRLFVHKKRPKLSAKEKKKVKEQCKGVKGAKKKLDCIKFRTIEFQLWDDHDRPKMHRLGNESQDDDGASIALWMAMGGLFLLLLIAVVVYFFFFSRGKEAKKARSGLVKGGSSKSSKGKRSLRSKVGKSKGSKTSHRSKKTLLSGASKGKKSRRSRRSKK